MVAIAISGCANLGQRTEILSRLIELNKNEKYKAKVIRQETINFKRVKRYINKGRIEKGISKALAVSKFGEPVLAFPEAEGQKWIYKAGNTDWFSGAKIYLLFDQDDTLINWECIDMDSSP